MKIFRADMISLRNKPRACNQKKRPIGAPSLSTVIASPGCTVAISSPIAPPPTIRLLQIAAAHVPPDPSRSGSPPEEKAHKDAVACAGAVAEGSLARPGGKPSATAPAPEETASSGPPAIQDPQPLCHTP